MVNAVNDAFRQVEAENRSRIIRDESGVNRVIMGRYPDGTYGIKVSKPGNDVTTAAGKDLIFNSNQNVLKVVHSGDFVLTHPAGTASVTATFAHNLGYVPAVLGFISDNYASGAPVYEQLPRFIAGDTGSILETIKIYVDAINVKAELRTPTSTPQPNPQFQASFTRNIHYYLLQESAS